MPELKESKKFLMEFKKWVYRTAEYGATYSPKSHQVNRDALILAVHQINILNNCRITVNSYSLVYHSMSIDYPDKMFKFSDYPKDHSYIDYPPLLDCLKYVYQSILDKKS